MTMFADDVIGEVYLHVSNGGLTVSVVEDGHGPTLVIRFGFFGHNQILRVHIMPEGLDQLAALFSSAARHEYPNVYGSAAYDPRPAPLSEDPDE